MTGSPDNIVVDEIQERGDLGGDATHALLRRTFTSAARRVPLALVTDDGQREPVEDTFHRFLVAKLKSLPAEMKTKTTDTEIGKLVYTTAHNWLIDRARTCTDHGSHRHTLEQILREDARFTQHPAVPALWGVNGVSADYEGTVRRLREAAAGVTGIRPGRKGNAKQRPGLAPLEDLARLLDAVLTAAAGWVPAATLTEVVEHRVRAFAPSFESLDTVEDEYHPDLARAVAALDAETVDVDACLHVAGAVWAALPDAERRILLMLGDVAGIQVELGVGRSQANVYQARLKKRLEAIDGTDADADFVLAILEAAAAAWRDRTSVNSVRQEAPRDTLSAGTHARTPTAEGERDV